MERYDIKIDKALAYLKEPSEISPTGSSPIVYLAYYPEDAMFLRQQIELVLKPKAEYYGFKVHTASIGEMVNKLTQENEYRDFWLDESVSEAEIFESVRDATKDSDFFMHKIEALQDKYADEGNALIVIKDLEMLHPIDMMGSIENKLYNKIKVPILVLYPGIPQGTARSFLNVYPQDGNYRSINF